MIEEFISFPLDRNQACVDLESWVGACYLGAVAVYEILHFGEFIKVPQEKATLKLNRLSECFKVVCRGQHEHNFLILLLVVHTDSDRSVLLWKAFGVDSQKAIAVEMAQLDPLSKSQGLAHFAYEFFVLDLLDLLHTDISRVLLFLGSFYSKQTYLKQILKRSFLFFALVWHTGGVRHEETVVADHSFLLPVVSFEPRG